MRIHASDAPLPLPRPLVVGVLLALAVAPVGMAYAGNLDNQTAEVVAGDPVEAWSLINGSRLTVTGGQSNEIGASDSSTIVLDNAQVTRVGFSTLSAIDLYGTASLEATNSRFSGGGVTLWNDGTSAHLVGSTITVHTADLDPTQRKAIGVDLVYRGGPTGATAYARIDGTRIDVQDAPSLPSLYGSGLGVRLQMGAVDIVNNSIVTAARVGAMLWGVENSTGVIRLNVDDSILQSGSGAAIQVMPLLDNTYEITVANGAQLLGGDGNLLLVGADYTFDERTDVDFTVDNARLRGNVTFDPASATNGTLDVILRNKAQIDGRFLSVTSASIDGDSTWLLTGDSTVSRLTLGSTGTIGLGDGTAFNTLTVDSFTGNGGTLAFNTQLGDDTSATDKLVITGDANGQANVRVLNAGGTGAKTDRGIELIDIGGASNAQFDLVGRAVGGQYEYFLVKDANGNWYLRSELANAPDPCVVDPSLPECKPIDPVDPVDPVDPLPPHPAPGSRGVPGQPVRHGPAAAPWLA